MNSRKPMNRDSPVVMKEMESVLKNPPSRSPPRGLSWQLLTIFKKQFQGYTNSFRGQENKEHSYSFHETSITLTPVSDKDSTVWEQTGQSHLWLEIQKSKERTAKPGKYKKRCSTSWETLFARTKSLENLLMRHIIRLKKKNHVIILIEAETVW